MNSKSRPYKQPASQLTTTTSQSRAAPGGLFSMQKQFSQKVGGTNQPGASSKPSSLLVTPQGTQLLAGNTYMITPRNQGKSPRS